MTGSEQALFNYEIKKERTGSRKEEEIKKSKENQKKKLKKEMEKIRRNERRRIRQRSTNLLKLLHLSWKRLIKTKLTK